MKRNGMRKGFWPALLLGLILPFGSYAESLTVINRTGSVVEMIQAASEGQDEWSRDLLAGRLLADGDSLELDLQAPDVREKAKAPWSLRMLDSTGKVYVVFGIEPSRSRKIVVGPEHLARLSLFAGSRRNVVFINQTGYPLLSLKLSPVGDTDWGEDLLEGKALRPGEKRTLELKALAGVLRFDVRFDLVSGGKKRRYEKPAVIMTDGAAVVLTVPEAGKP